MFSVAIGTRKYNLYKFIWIPSARKVLLLLSNFSNNKSFKNYYLTRPDTLSLDLALVKFFFVFSINFPANISVSDLQRRNFRMAFCILFTILFFVDSSAPWYYLTREPECLAAKCSINSRSGRDFKMLS